MPYRCAHPGPERPSRSIRRGRTGYGPDRPEDHLDRRYENAQIAELPDAPIDALRGLGRAGSAALRKAIGVKTIRDLADNRFVLAAQEIVRLAEGSAVLALNQEVAPLVTVSPPWLY